MPKVNGSFWESPKETENIIYKNRQYYRERFLKDSNILNECPVKLVTIVSNKSGSKIVTSKSEINKFFK